MVYHILCGRPTGVRLHPHTGGRLGADQLSKTAQAFHAAPRWGKIHTAKPRAAVGGVYMSHSAGFGILILGAILAILGIVMIAGLLDWLLNVIGFILLVIGVILAVMGVVQMSSGKNRL